MAPPSKDKRERDRTQTRSREREGAKRGNTAEGFETPMAMSRDASAELIPVLGASQTSTSSGSSDLTQRLLLAVAPVIEDEVKRAEARLEAKIEKTIKTRRRLREPHPAIAAVGVQNHQNRGRPIRQ